MASEREMAMGHLCTSRKVGQSVSLFVEGMEIRIKIIEAAYGTARIMIVAPKERVAIRREEQMRNEE